MHLCFAPISPCICKHNEGSQPSAELLAANSSSSYHSSYKSQATWQEAACCAAATNCSLQQQMEACSCLDICIWRSRPQSYCSWEDIGSSGPLTHCAHKSNFLLTARECEREQSIVEETEPQAVLLTGHAPSAMGIAAECCRGVISFTGAGG